MDRRDVVKGVVLAGATFCFSGGAFAQSKSDDPREFFFKRKKTLKDERDHGLFTEALNSIADGFGDRSDKRRAVETSAFREAIQVVAKKLGDRGYPRITSIVSADDQRAYVEARTTDGKDFILVLMNAKYNRHKPVAYLSAIAVILLSMMLQRAENLQYARRLGLMYPVAYMEDFGKGYDIMDPIPTRVLCEEGVWTVSYRKKVGQLGSARITLFKLTSLAKVYDAIVDIDLGRLSQ